MALSVLVASAATAPAVVQASPASAAIAAPVTLVSSDPVKNGTMAPRSWVKLEFSRPLDPAQVQISVRDDVGGELQAGQPQITGRTITQKLFPGISTGHYSLSYTVAATRDKPINGEVPFKVTTKPKHAAPVHPTRPTKNNTPAKNTRTIHKPQPTPTATTTAAKPAAQATNTDRHQSPWIILGSAAGALALAAGGFALWKRRRSTNSQL